MMLRALLLVAVLAAPALASPGDRAAAADELARSTPPPVWAFLETCHHEGGAVMCATFRLADPFRTLSDCLIAIERADQGLRRIRSQLTAGTCAVGDMQ